MGDVVNLNDRRKQKARTDKTLQSVTNRAKFGRTKLEREREEQERLVSARKLDGAKREDDDPKGA